MTSIFNVPSYVLLLQTIPIKMNRYPLRGHQLARYPGDMCRMRMYERFFPRNLFPCVSDFLVPNYGIGESHTRICNLDPASPYLIQTLDTLQITGRSDETFFLVVERVEECTVNTFLV